MDELRQDWSATIAPWVARLLWMYNQPAEDKEDKRYKYKAEGLWKSTHSVSYIKGNILRCCGIVKGKILVFRNLRHSIQTFISTPPSLFHPSQTALFSVLSIFNVSFFNLRMPTDFWDIILVILLRERMHAPHIFRKFTGFVSHS